MSLGSGSVWLSQLTELNFELSSSSVQKVQLSSVQFSQNLVINENECFIAHSTHLNEMNILAQRLFDYNCWFSRYLYICKEMFLQNISKTNNCGRLKRNRIKTKW